MNAAPHTHKDAVVTSPSHRAVSSEHNGKTEPLDTKMNKPIAGRNGTKLSNSMSSDVEDRLKPITAISSEDMEAFEQTLRDANTAEEVKHFMEETLGVSAEHLDFLVEKAGLEKLRQFWYDVIKFDLTYGVSTASFIPETVYQKIANADPNKLAAPEKAAHGVKHRSSLTPVIESSLETVRLIVRDRTGVDHLEKASFFDLGCGQGKAVMIAAAKQDFRKVRGIDYYQDVLDIAEQNVDQASDELGLGDKKNRITFDFTDAGKFDDYNGQNVIYMYNPFDEEVMVDVEQKLRECDGKVFVIYNKPQHIHLFEQTGWKVEDEGKRSHIDPDQRVVILSWGYEEPAKQPGYKPPHDRFYGPGNQLPAPTIS